MHQMDAAGFSAGGIFLLWGEECFWFLNKNLTHLNRVFLEYCSGMNTAVSNREDSLRNYFAQMNKKTLHERSDGLGERSKSRDERKGLTFFMGEKDAKSPRSLHAGCYGGVKCVGINYR